MGRSEEVGTHGTGRYPLAQNVASHVVWIPRSLLEETFPTIAEDYEDYLGHPEKIIVRVNPAGDNLSEVTLEELDCRGMLSPAVWVRRSALEDIELGEAVEDIIKHSRIALFPVDPLEEFRPKESVWWGLGSELIANRYWQTDVLKAIIMMSKWSPDELQAELDSGERTVRGGPATAHLWEWEWVIRPITIGQSQERVGKFPFLEYDAIPFYRDGDDKRAFEMIINSFLHIPLLGEITDTWAANAKLIEKARQRKELPPTETRGRPKGRPRYLVREVARMRDQGELPIYQIAKRLGMPRSTVYDYLTEYSEMRGEGDPPHDD